MTERQVCDLDLPTLVVKMHQVVGGVAGVVGQCGQQAVGPAEHAAVGGTGADLGLDHSQREVTDPGQVGAVGQQCQHRRASDAGGAESGTGPLDRDVPADLLAVEGAVCQNKHVRGQVADQVVSVIGFTLAGGAEDGADQAAGRFRTSSISISRG